MFLHIVAVLKQVDDEMIFVLAVTVHHMTRLCLCSC